MLFNKFLFKFKYFHSNSNIFIWFQMLLFSNLLFEFKYFYALWQIFIIIKIFCVNELVKFRSTRGVSCRLALIRNCPTLKLHVLAVSTQWIACYFSVLGEVWDTVAMRKVRHKSVDLKSVQGNILKSVTRITKGGGDIKLTRLIGSA